MRTLRAKTEAEDPSAMVRVAMAARMSGVSAHTIRMWERRYEAVLPARTDAGGRLYSDGDIARLRTLKVLTEQGHAISAIAPLSDAELAKLSGRVTPRGDGPHAALRHRLYQAIEQLDLVGAEHILFSAVASMNPREFVIDLVAPLLGDIGRGWEQGTLRVVHEHAATSLLRSTLGSLVRAHRHASGYVNERRPVLVATPEGEQHELGALCAALLAALHDEVVFYLGPNLPAHDLVFAAQKLDARLVLLSLSEVITDEKLASVAAVEAALPTGIDLVIGGAGARRPALRRAARVDSLDDLDKLLVNTRVRHDR